MISVVEMYLAYQVGRRYLENKRKKLSREWGLRTQFAQKAATADVVLRMVPLEKVMNEQRHGKCGGLVP